MSLINNFVKTADIETDDMVAAYLARGGNVTQCDTSARTEDINYTQGFGRRKKQVAAKVDEA